MNFQKFKFSNIKNLHLAISVILIIPIALAFGINPHEILFKLFKIKVETINLTNIFRAMMGLYLGISSIWIMGIFKPKLWAMATMTNIIFMGSLALGRLLSLVLDGPPSIYFVIGLICELTLALWGVMNLKKHSALCNFGS